MIQQIIERINANLVERQCFLGRSPEDMSPWGLFFAYRISSTHVRSLREISNSSEVVKSLREAFRTIDVRWNVAGSILLLSSLPILSLIADSLVQVYISSSLRHKKSLVILDRISQAEMDHPKSYRRTPDPKLATCLNAAVEFYRAVLAVL